MISISEAISIVKHQCKPLEASITLPIEKTNGYRLYNDVYSPINMPPFRQSAMDGYALNLHDDLNYKLMGEIKAGDGQNPILNPGEAYRIFTGAAVPDTANAVMMQEKVKLNDKVIAIEHSILPETNIRPMAEQVKKGEIALKKHTKLIPAGIGYLSSLGITEVTVFKKPSVAIITTGNELIEGGQPLDYGKIYESNSKMLSSALNGLGFHTISTYKVEDNYKSTLDVLNTAISNSDLVIITGGISVGDYDFVGKALNELQVEEHFYKVKQKPGKPLFFGTKQNTSVFALPGNPAAALSCFYLYVYIALQIMTHNDPIELPRTKAVSASKYVRKGDRPQFLKAIYNHGKAHILEGQASSMQQTFAVSNALVYVSEAITTIDIGDPVETILLPV